MIHLPDFEDDRTLSDVYEEVKRSLPKIEQRIAELRGELEQDPGPKTGPLLEHLTRKRQRYSQWLLDNTRHLANGPR